MKKYKFKAGTYEFEYYIIVGTDYDRVLKEISKLHRERVYHDLENQRAVFYCFNCGRLIQSKWKFIWKKH